MTKNTSDLPRGRFDFLFFLLSFAEKLKTMKSLFPFALAAFAVIAACTPETFTLNPVISRNYALGPGPHSGSGGDSTAVLPPAVRDTSVLVSAVEFPEDYDWRRDTAFGQVAGKVLLFRNGDRILEIPAGATGKASVDPDMHHLVDGHLYTEYTDGAHTYVSRDGDPLYTFDGKEYLRGLLPLNGKLYTLSQRKDGKGFVLRCDGQTLLDKDSGLILKSFRDYPDRQSGALYENEGKVCFHYSKGLDKDKLWYSVQDLVESQIYVYDGELLDARYFGDDLCVVSTLSGRGLQMTVGKRQDIVQKAASPMLSGVSLVKSGQEVFAIGRIKYIHLKKTALETCIWSSSGVQSHIDGEYQFVLDADKNIFMYGSDGNSGTEVLNSGCERVSSIGGMVPYSRRVAAMHGAQMYLALTPADSSGRTVLWSKGKETELAFNGFLTDIDVRSE